MALPSIVISVMQVNEGLKMLFLTHEYVRTKLCLNYFDVICILTNGLAIIVQAAVDCLVGRNLVLRNAKLITKLSNNLFILDNQKKV
jgi:hypothetical protein